MCGKRAKFIYTINTNHIYPTIYIITIYIRMNVLFDLQLTNETNLICKKEQKTLRSLIGAIIHSCYFHRFAVYVL